MPITEFNQRRLLFEQAAREGITKRKISTIGEIFSKLIGQSDVGVKNLGLPLAPTYLARDGDIIDIQRMSSYLAGLFRDIQVLDLSNQQLEDQLTLISLEFWSRMQLVKNRAQNVRNAAIAERQRVATGGRWAFSDSLNTTTNINMQLSSVWIDTNEGLAFLPNLAKDQSITPSDILIKEQAPPVGGSFIGSEVFHAFDGLDNTNWRASFEQYNTWASCVVEFSEPKSINSLMIDPVGFGITFTIEFDTGTGFTQALKDNTYQRSTYPVDGVAVKRVRVMFSSAEASFPRTAGIRALVFYSATSSRFASLYSKVLNPQYSFNEIEIELDANIPSGSRITPYWAAASGGVWTKMEPKNWYPISTTTTTQKSIDQSSPFTNSGGVFRVQLSDQSINDIDGKLEVGTNQFEVSCFKKDWLSEGESPKILSPQIFKGQSILRTWTDVPFMYSSGWSTIPRLVQRYGTTNVTLSPHFVKRGSNILLRRKVADQPYSEMCWVPFVANNDLNTVQPGYNYRFKMQVFCARDSFYDQGRYWFIQGFRQLGSKTYREIGRTLGAFSMYINGLLVAADNLPYTAYVDNSLEEGADLGRPYSIKLLAGWNTIEVFLNVVDTTKMLPDIFDSGDPYLQLCLMPNFLDFEFQQAMNITKVLGSGEVRPVSEFDLLWNLPLDPTFWAWADTRDSVMFNTTSVKPIDGFFTGKYPRSVLTYQGIDFDQEVQDLYLRFDLERDAQSNTGPLFKGYKVMVR
jgi:hypothetical protein